jgi:TonB family protein
MKKLATGLSFVIALGCASAWAQDSIVAARELYASAAYEDALDVLSKMRTSSAEIATTDAEVLKAFCLLALRRDDEAKAVMEGVITERPMYSPSEDEASPRIREAFQEVRRKLLPSVARQLYASAKEDFEKKNSVSAAAKFAELLQVLSDPDLAKDETLADLRLLADGFREVSAAAANVATAADTQPRQQAANGGSVAAPVAPAVRGGTALAGTASSAASGGVSPVPLPVTPPVPINQQMPPWRGELMTTRNEFTGAIDIVIDEQGHVESVSLRKSVHPLYDSLLVEAARAWTYRPAMRGNQPIKFQKTLVVKLNTR